MKRPPMKPGKPPVRKTRLARGALVRNAEKTRQAAEKAKQPPVVKLRTPKRRPPMDRNLRDSLLLRGFRRCDICGNHLPADIWEAHHRRLRSQGGPDEAANLLSIDHQCHWRAHHWRDWARDRGYIVHAGSDFAIRPVWRHGQSWQIPTPDGWTACEPPADIDLSLTERNAA